MQCNTLQTYETIRVPYGDHNLVAYKAGTGTETLLLLNGGPGLSCDYLRDPHLQLAGNRFTVVAYDQLGTGASDNPDDASLWTIERYVEEVEHIRIQLGLGKVHLLGQSWGSVLSIEYALTYPDAIKSLILTNGIADVSFHLEEINRLRNALGSETVAMMQRHEAEGTYEHPEYQAAVTLLDYRHLCRLDNWPESLLKSLDNWNKLIYNTMQGPNEYYFTGNLKNWSRLKDLHKIIHPTLIIQGMHDMLTPASALKMHAELANSQIKVFKNSGHLPVFEEPKGYFNILKKFLNF